MGAVWDRWSVDSWVSFAYRACNCWSWMTSLQRYQASRTFELQQSHYAIMAHCALVTVIHVTHELWVHLHTIQICGCFWDLLSV